MTVLSAPERVKRGRESNAKVVIGCGVDYAVRLCVHAGAC